MKKIFKILGVVVLIIAGTFLFYLFNQKDILDLQKAYISAENEKEKESLILELEKYYMQQDIPDSLSQKVEENVSLCLDTLSFNAEKIIQSSAEIENIYELENYELDLLEYTAVAVLKDQQRIARQLFQHLQKLANEIDHKTENVYWRDFIAQFDLRDKERFGCWLKARQAAALCRDFDDDDLKWKEAEIYAGLTLSYLNKVTDKRMKLDVVQALQYILFQYRTYYELSFGLTEKYLKISREIKYKLREMGLHYNYAKALHDNGKNNQALIEIKKLLLKVQENKEVPYSIWYEINGRIALAEIYWKNGKYRKALLEANKTEDSNLSVDAKIRLRLVKANILGDLGEYEASEDEYLKALTIASAENAVLNQIIILGNLGAHFVTLSELDKALHYSEQALDLLCMENPENYSERLRILMNIAEIWSAGRNREQYERTISEVEKYLKLVKIPVRKARRLNSLARLNSENREYEKAVMNITEAISIFELNGFMQMELAARLDYVKILQKQKKYTLALAESKRIVKISRKISDRQKTIEALALSGELYYKSGREEEALSVFEKLIAEIEGLSSAFMDSGKLILYRQKVYDILKQTVWFEFKRGHHERAVQKLDYAKARAFKCFEKENKNNQFNINYTELGKIRERLGKNYIILDYLLMPDSLIVFQLTTDSILAYSKKMNRDSLQQMIYDYLGLIKNTVNIFADYQEKRIEEHYNSTIKLSNKIADILLGWPELYGNIRNVESVFIIPDEFLYQLPFCTLVSELEPEARFLVQDADITNVPALSLIPDERTRNHKPKKFLISANPVFKKRNTLIKYAKNKFPEVDELAMSTDAAKKAEPILSQLKAYDGFISVNHGLANLIDPEFSYIDLYLEGKNEHKADVRRITINDVHELDLSGVDYVMLFGCETATGKIYKGSGMRGFEQEFLLSGVSNVLASLWKVDAAITIPMAQSILKTFLQEGQLASSLQDVQLENIRRLKSDPYYKKPHPYFWGGFSVSSVSMLK